MGFNLIVYYEHKSFAQLTFETVCLKYQFQKWGLYSAVGIEPLCCRWHLFFLDYLLKKKKNCPLSSSLLYCIQTNIIKKVCKTQSPFHPYPPAVQFPHYPRHREPLFLVPHVFSFQKFVMEFLAKIRIKKILHQKWHIYILQHFFHLIKCCSIPLTVVLYHCVGNFPTLQNCTFIFVYKSTIIPITPPSLKTVLNFAILINAVMNNLAQIFCASISIRRSKSTGF